jgi:LacI family transcriptional regulator
MVCFDDHDLFRLHSPSITCVSQPIEEIGRQIVNVLMQELNHPSSTSQHLVLQPTLEVRESTMRIAETII